MNPSGTTIVSAAQCAFVNKMVNTLHSLAADIDPAKVVLTGATHIREAFPADEVAIIIESYTEGIEMAFAIAIGAAGASLIPALPHHRSMIFGGKSASAADIEVRSGNERADKTSSVDA